MGQKIHAEKNLLCVLPTTPTLHGSFLLDVFMSILSPCWALQPLTLGTISTEMANDDNLRTCYGTGSPVLQEFPISTHYVTSQPSMGVDASTQLCGGWCQAQTTAVVTVEALCCSASKSVVCVKAGKCQGLSWWFRSDQIWNVSGCCMCTDVRGAWSELKKAEWSWWLSRKAHFLIKKDSTRQCS